MEEPELKCILSDSKSRAYSSIPCSTDLVEFEYTIGCSLAKEGMSQTYPFCYFLEVPSRYNDPINPSSSSRSIYPAVYLTLALKCLKCLLIQHIPKMNFCFPSNIAGSLPVFPNCICSFAKDRTLGDILNTSLSQT